MAVVTKSPTVILEPPKIKSATVSSFPIYLPNYPDLIRGCCSCCLMFPYVICCHMLSCFHMLSYVSICCHVSFDTTQFDNFLTFGTMKYFRLMYFHFSSPEVNYFSKIPSSFNWRMVFRSKIWELCIWSVHIIFPPMPIQHLRALSSVPFLHAYMISNSKKQGM